ncbi:CD63 antigen [Asbolus verrucosus]|uniref:Tetraspanin n=1 Tax=Asbolus verrucosus TaxID=1661398 RepID=A0A482VT51_ASBVE|nr:CD63 antigen [Asbolus verrucosus]
MDCNSILRKYSRYVLIIFNFLFVLTGVVILSVGASVKAYYHEYVSFLNNKYIYASDLLIIIGVIIFLIAFFGCCGALKENACMTLTFNCCGVNNYTDWQKPNSSTHGELPITCCQFPAGATGNVSCNAATTGLRKEGCLEVFTDYIEGHAVTIESVGLTLALIQLLGIILSCYLSKQIKSDYETV